MVTLIVLLALAFPPCALEDSNNCYWDASARGNGHGSNFITLADHVVQL